MYHWRFNTKEMDTAQVVEGEVSVFGVELQIPVNSLRLTFARTCSASYIITEHDSGTMKK